MFTSGKNDDEDEDDGDEAMWFNKVLACSADVVTEISLSCNDFSLQLIDRWFFFTCQSKSVGGNVYFWSFCGLVFYHFLPWQLCIILTLYLDMAVWTTMSTSLSLSQSIALVQTKISNQLLNGLAWKSVQILYCSQRRNLTDCGDPNHWELDAKWYTRNNVSQRTILKTVVIH